MNFKYLLTVSFLIAFNAFMFAPPPAPPSSGGAGCWPPPCVPIDGGITILVVAGAVYGGKKLYFDNKKRKSI
jgi:hypothetical protein